MAAGVGGVAALLGLAACDCALSGFAGFASTLNGFAALTGFAAFTSTGFAAVTGFGFAAFSGFGFAPFTGLAGFSLPTGFPAPPGPRPALGAGTNGGRVGPAGCVGASGLGMPELPSTPLPPVGIGCWTPPPDRSRDAAAAGECSPARAETRQRQADAGRAGRQLAGDLDEVLILTAAATAAAVGGRHRRQPEDERFAAVLAGSARARVARAALVVVHDRVDPERRCNHRGREAHPR